MAVRAVLVKPELLLCTSLAWDTARSPCDHRGFRYRLPPFSRVRLSAGCLRLLEPATVGVCCRTLLFAESHRAVKSMVESARKAPHNT